MAKAYSDLGLADRRLAGLLNLAGANPLEYEHSIRPTVLAGDATQAGYNPTKGRRWACSVETGQGAGVTANYFIQTRVRVNITSWSIETWDAGTLAAVPTRGAVYQGVHGALGTGTNATVCSWLELAASSADAGPVLYASAAGAFGAGGIPIARIKTASNIDGSAGGGIMSLEAGGNWGFELFTVAAVTVKFLLFGRTI